MLTQDIKCAAGVPPSYLYACVSGLSYMIASVTSISPQLPAAWTCLHMLSMRLCSLSKTQTKQAMASLLNCMRSWRCRVSSSSLLCSNVDRKPLALSLIGARGGDAPEHSKRWLCTRLVKISR